VPQDDTALHYSLLSYTARAEQNSPEPLAEDGSEAEVSKCRRFEVSQVSQASCSGERAHEAGALSDEWRNASMGMEALQEEYVRAGGTARRTSERLEDVLPVAGR
jgi:hypothetical protein